MASRPKLPVPVALGGALGHVSKEAECNPLARYMLDLRSPRSRRTMLSVLTRAARELAKLDGVPEKLRGSIAAESYQWGAPGALTNARVALVVAAVAESTRKGSSEKQKAMARLALAALRGVARAAFGLGMLSVEERQRIDDVKAPKLTASLRGRALTDEEKGALYAVCADDPTPRGRRDAALIATMLGAGLRRFEASDLDLDDFSMDGRLASFRVLHGKGDKADNVPAPPDVAAAVQDWIDARGRAPGPLFLASSGRGRPLDHRLSPGGIYKILVVRAEAAGIAKTAPHDLRRTMITSFLERTGDLALAQRHARHSSPSTTARYDMRGKEALKQALVPASTGYRSKK